MQSSFRWRPLVKSWLPTLFGRCNSKMTSIMFLAKVIRKTVKTSGLPKNSVVCILVVRFSSHACYSWNATHFKQPQFKIQLAQIAYLLKFTNRAQFFPKNSHLDSGPTLIVIMTTSLHHSTQGAEHPEIMDIAARKTEEGSIRWSAMYSLSISSYVYPGLEVRLCDWLQVSYCVYVPRFLGICAF